MRVPAWQERLEEVFRDAAGRRFRWGRHDCCQFVAQASAAITGVDRRSIFAPYVTKAGAVAILAELGGMASLLSKAFGEPVHCSLASAGDIVLIDMGRGEQPAVCMGVESFAPGRSQLEHRSTLKAAAAWKI